jgi:hypothetical protein
VEFAQQLVEVVIATIIRGIGKGLTQCRRDSQFVERMMDANDLPVAQRRGRMAKGIVERHGKVTLGARMSFTIA